MRAKQKEGPLRGFPQTIDSASLRASILSFLSDTVSRTAEALAKMSGGSVLLVQQNLRSMAKSGKVFSPGHRIEGGETRLLFQRKADK